MSSKRSRKSLDDALAQQFIYGEKQRGILQEPAQEQVPLEPSPEQSSLFDGVSEVARSATGEPLGATEKIPNDSTLMGKFQTPPKEATVRFTVDLPASMHRKLSILAARTGKKKAEIVRVLLDEALENVHE
jgi:hypothetical protein